MEMHGRDVTGAGAGAGVEVVVARSSWPTLSARKRGHKEQSSGCADVSGWWVAELDVGVSGEHWPVVASAAHIRARP
jgi:hypothetical protein